MKLWCLALLFCFILGCTKKEEPIKIINESVSTNKISLLDPSEHVFSDDMNIVFKPIGFQVDRLSNYYILDRGLMCIKVFDKNFRYLHTIGSKGSGPGEFTNGVKSIKLINDSILVVFDYQLKRFSFFTISGKYIKEILYKNKYVDDFYFKNENIIITPFSVDDEIPAIIVTDYNFNELNQFGEILPIKENIFDLLSKSSSKSMFKDMFSSSSFTRINCLNDNIYYAQSNPYRIQKYSKFGKLQISFSTYCDFSTEFHIEIQEKYGSITREVKSPPGIYNNINIYKEKYILALVPKPQKAFYSDSSKIICWLDCYDLDGKLLDRIDVDLKSNYPLGTIVSNIEGDYYSILLNNSVKYPKIIRYKIKINE